MNLNDLIAKIKSHPKFETAGMILCHNGVVRATDRSGRKVVGLRVSVDHERLRRIISESRSRPGIVDVQVEIAENRFLAVGEDVMLLAVAGDVRENVIAVLKDTLEAIKTTATRKTEHPA
jgi:molybdopterin synthase catalytic subunit